MLKSEDDFQMKDETEAMQAVIKREQIKYEDEDEEYLFGVPDEEKPSVVAKDEQMEHEVMVTADESPVDNDFIFMSIETQLEKVKLGGSEESGDLKNNKGLIREGDI